MSRFHTIAFVSLIFISAWSAFAQERSMGPKAIKGDYGFTCTGTVNGNRFAGIGQLTCDGRSAYRGAGTDGRGQVTYDQTVAGNPAGQLHTDFVVMSNGNDAPDPDSTLKADVLRIENNVLLTYGATDFGWVWDTHVIHGDRVGAGNFIVIPLTQGAAYTLKYELESRNPEFLSSALDQFELAENLYPYWGHGWLSPSVVNFMTLSLYRLREDAGQDPLFASRIETDWRAALEILKEEADGLLGEELPFSPLDSSTSGDTKADEDAWASTPLSTAALFLPDDPHAQQWEATAKALAYAAITRPSDPPYTRGAVKTTTVSEDFSLNNHGHTRNAYYTAATIELLEQGALPYRIVGRDIPEEFSHNTEELYGKYETYIADQNGWPIWNVVCDEGDPTDLPLVMDDHSEYRYARLKAESGMLWRSTEPSPTIAENELWAAIQNHKVAWRYFVNVFLWHWPKPSGRRRRIAESMMRGAPDIAWEVRSV